MTFFRKPKLVIIFFVFTSLSLNSISSSASPDKLPYADHCASVVPESNSKMYGGRHPFVHSHTGYYYTGGGTGNSPSRNSSYDHHQVQNSIEFLTWSSQETDVQGLFKLRATLQMEKTSTFYYVGNSTSSQPRYPDGYRTRSIPADRRRPVTFRLNGFWSETSAKLCMVGYGHGYSKQGTSLNYPAVLKLYNVLNSTSVTSLISGTLESLINSSDIVKDPKYFDPISILMLPRIGTEPGLKTWGG